jgi:hypothetical protein
VPVTAGFVSLKQLIVTEAVFAPLTLGELKGLSPWLAVLGNPTAYTFLV